MNATDGFLYFFTVFDSLITFMRETNITFGSLTFSLWGLMISILLFDIVIYFIWNFLGV